jgi:uncharacterized protein YbjT (DUF2867 family)
MTPTILVTGGTGTLGRHTTPLLRAAGHELRVLSRHEREAADGIEYVACDLLKGDGIEPALDGIETVLHLAGANKGDDVATANLVRAAVRTGVRHFVYISIIGADRVPIGYLKTKLRAEQAVAGSGIPFTILRAAQFHELVLTMARTMAKLPVTPVPGGLRLQPVAAREVAVRLAELTLGVPAGHVPDLAGPKLYDFGELTADYLAAHGKRRRPRLPLRLPGKAGRSYRAGENLSLDAAEMAEQTWEQFLKEQTR